METLRIVKALLKSVLIKRKGLLLRTTLVRARYDMGLALLAFQRAHPLYQESLLYKKMERHIESATRKLLNENVIIEDYNTPEDLRREPVCSVTP